MYQPDAIIEVRFRTARAGGKQKPIRGDFYSCPLVVGPMMFDCRLILSGKLIDFGETYKIPIKLLNPQAALPYLLKGKPIKLWEGKDIADGKIIELSHSEFSGNSRN